MKPTKSPITDQQRDLFRSQLSTIIDQGHSLVKLSNIVNWSELEQAFGQTFCEDNGRPGISTRLMVALHYLKFTYDLSDEAVVKGWVENPYWQYFYMKHQSPKGHSAPLASPSLCCHV